MKCEYKKCSLFYFDGPSACVCCVQFCFPWFICWILFSCVPQMCLHYLSPQLPSVLFHVVVNSSVNVVFFCPVCLVFPGSICDIIPSNTVKRHLIFFPTHLVVDSSISVTNLVTDKLNLGNTQTERITQHSQAMMILLKYINVNTCDDGLAKFLVWHTH